MKVVNLFGGPGTGKSTIAAGLFYYMKLRNAKVELVTEYAKDLVYSNRTDMFEAQEYIFAKQNHRLHRLRGKVDWAITDSPLLLSHFYIPEGFPADTFIPFVDSIVDLYNNTNIFLNRVKPFQQYGRVQNEQESKEKDRMILSFLEQYHEKFHIIDADESAIEEIYRIIEC